MTTATVTKRLRAEGLPLELVRGEGYHYFIFDTPEHYDSHSVYIPHFRSWPEARWLEEGRDFAARVNAELAERKATDAAEPEPFRIKLHRRGTP